MTEVAQHEHFFCMLQPTTKWVREQLVTACAILEESLNTPDTLVTADAMETSDAGIGQEFEWFF